MKVLWTSLIAFPDLNKVLGKVNMPFCGWLHSSAKNLINKEIELAVVCMSEKEIKKCINGITYYTVAVSNLTKTSPAIDNRLNWILSDFSPDIINLQGVEYSLAYAFTQIKTDIPIVATIQGLASECYKYVDANFSFGQYLKNLTAYELFPTRNLYYQKRYMNLRGKLEVSLLKSIKAVIGRTEWDKKCVKGINPSLHYYFCNETLRDSFYQNEWTYESCRKHSIFLSNSNIPLKGAHVAIKAFAQVSQKYSDACLYIVGKDVLNIRGLELLKMSSYNKYLLRLIKKYKLVGKVKFLGNLSEEEMAKAYLKSNIYVLASFIENSSNSLCEAQILGVPVIASNVGGTSSLVEEKMNGYLYEPTDYKRLAELILEIFEKNEYSISKRERDLALVRHNSLSNALCLKSIYNQILDKS